MADLSFSEQLARNDRTLTAAERRVADYLLGHREAAIIASATDLGYATGTSDATIIRAARKLGFAGLDALRRALAGDLRRDLSLTERFENSRRRVAGAPAGALGETLETLRAALNGLTALPVADFDAVLAMLGGARRIRIFGTGPSGYLAGYFAAQLSRLGADARALCHTGHSFADDLNGLREGDSVFALAYGRAYPEVTALFDVAQEMSLKSTLVTSPGPAAPDYRASITLHVARGQADGVSLHTATLALIEALLVGYGVAEHTQVEASLKALNDLRHRVAGTAPAPAH